MIKDLEKVKNRLYLYFVMEIFGIFIGFILPLTVETTSTLNLVITIYEFLCGIVFLSSITPLCNLLTGLTKTNKEE